MRILAAAAVFLSHTRPPDLIQGPTRTFMAAGYNGVTLFFVLSGFVLAWNYADRLGRPVLRNLWSFAVARFARIYPLYLFALLVAVMPALVNGGAGTGIWLHVLALQAWSPDVFVAFGYNGPAWSIGVEFFLYACFPVIVLILGRARRSPGVLLAVAAFAILGVAALAWWFSATGRGVLPTTDAGSAHRWLYRTPVTRLGDFTLGVACALLVRAVTRPPAWLAVAAQCVGLGAIVLFMAWPRVLFSVWSWDLTTMVPAGLLIWGLASAPRSGLARPLGSRPMVLLGEASFAFYLLHATVLPRLEVPGVDTLRGWAFVTLMQFTVISMLAIGAHIGLERPAQRALRRWLDRRPRSTTAEELALVAPKDQVLI